MLIHNACNQDIFLPYIQTVAAPGAGNNLVLDAPLNSLSEPLAMSFALTTDANAADRTLFVSHKHGAQIIILGACAHPQTASLTKTYFMHANASLSNNANSTYVPIPIPNYPYFLEDDDLLVNIENKQAGDTLSSIIITWKLWVYPT